MRLVGPVAVSSPGGMAQGTMARRYQGRLHVTATLKATFAPAPRRSLVLITPEPLRLDDVPDHASSGPSARAIGGLDR